MRLVFYGDYASKCADIVVGIHTAREEEGRVGILCCRLHKRLRTELPGKVLPPMPKKNKQSSTASNLLSAVKGGDDSDASSISSISTMGVPQPIQTSMNSLSVRGKSTLFSFLQQKFDSSKDHRKSPSVNSFSGRASPRSSIDSRSMNQSPVPAPTPSDEVRCFPVIKLESS
jgi:hypothetical protein